VAVEERHDLAETREELADHGLIISSCGCR